MLSGGGSGNGISKRTVRFSSLKAGSGFHSSFYLQILQLFLQLACDWDIHGDLFS